MGRLLRIMKQHWWKYSLAIALMIVSIVLDMYNPFLVGEIIDRVIKNGEIAYLNNALLLLAAITVCRAVLGYIKEYGFDLVSSTVILDLRQSLFDHIQKLAFSFFDKNNTGELMSRIKDDTENVMDAICYGFMLFLEQIIYFAIASIIMFSLSWKLALISLMTMPVIEYIVFKLERKIGEIYEKISDQRALLNTTAQQNIAGVRVVKAFGREKYEIEKFLKQNEENYKINFNQAKILAKYNPTIEFFSNVVIVLVVSFGGYFVIGGELSLGKLVAFSNYVHMLIWPIRSMGWLTNVIARCVASIKKIENIFNEEPTIKNCENPQKPEKAEGNVVFKDVSFEFAEEFVLNEINIDVKAGSTVAIMGATGAGKSSLINLIGRYYDCSKGCIYFDGIDVRDLDLSFLRKNVAVVMQDTFLFSDTIEQNIRFGANDVTDEEFMAAARDAMVDEFVSQMPLGYNTIIGERGIGLSGGQKQRISIARAFLAEAKVLILDDATSALDMETEYFIQKALERRKGITCFIIAHRISAVKNADQILYFEDGRIVERGTHSELLALKGRYYETYREQYRDYVEALEREVI